MIGPRVLVTGGTGVVGRPLVAALLAMGREVVVLSRKAPKNNDFLAHPGCTHLPGDQILRLCRSYLARSFDGNLLDLLGWPHWLAFRDNDDGTRLPPLEILLDNRALDGFLDFFARTTPACRLGCQRCGHCQAWSQKALRFSDETLRQQYINNMDRNLRHLVEAIPTALQTAASFAQWQQQAARQVIK